MQLCMEAEMNDALGLLAGILGMLCAIAHGFLGETKVVRPIKDISPSAKRVLHAIMFLSAVYWFIAGAAAAASPFLIERDRLLALSIAGTIYFSSAAANFWAMRGRHFGWVALSAAGALAWFAI
jgi:hypothetical protein